MDELMKQPVELEAEPGEYRDAEGFLCCGKCGERKEEYYTMHSGVREKLSRSCACDRAREEAERQELGRRAWIGHLKSDCFDVHAMADFRFENAALVPPAQLEKAQAFVRNWETVKRENAGLLLWGDVGTCKTYTAACIANALMEQRIPCFMREMTYYSNAKFDELPYRCSQLDGYDLVVFDDFGVERGTEYSLELVFRVINTRCESGKPAIVTTNLTLDELQHPQDLAHRRIYDRVLEMCVPVHFSGESVRGAIHRKKMDVMRDIFA